MNRHHDPRPRSIPVFLLALLVLLLCAPLPANGAVRINSITCSRATVSKGQTGIQVTMDVENLDTASAVTLTAANLTFTLGSYEVAHNSPALPTSIGAGSHLACVFTVSVNPLSTSGVCTVDGTVTTSGGSDPSADVIHTWTVQQPSELVITSIIGPSTISRGSIGNQAIMDVSRSGEASAWLNAVDLVPDTPTNYLDWVLKSPQLPQNFTRSSWWNKKWPFRRMMSITNQSQLTLPATYEIRLTFDHAALVDAGKSLPSGDDIRIIYDDGVNFYEIPRYLDTRQSSWQSPQTTIWFRLQTPLAPAPAADKKYAIYYGAGMADAMNPPDDPNAVFIFDDDFESGNRPAPLNWTIGKIAAYTTAWAIGIPGPAGQITPLSAYSGTRIAATGLTTQYTGQVPAAEVMWLRSPSIDLAGKLNPTLTFYDVFDIEDPGAPYDYGTLRAYRAPVAAAGIAPAPATALLRFEDQYLNEHYTWQPQSYGLSALVGERIYLEYCLRVDQLVFGYGWGLDDIRIRQIADHEPDNPLLGIEEQVPLAPTIKAFFDISVSPAAVSGPDQIDGLAEGVEINSGQPISDDSAAVPLVWEIAGQDITAYGNPFYMMPKTAFNAGETVYVRGSGYTAGVYYRVAWYNPSGNLVTTTTVTPQSSGVLFDQRTMSPTDGSGQWRLIVTNAAGTVSYAETGFHLNTKPQLLSELILPEYAIQGQQITLTERVKNTGQTPAIGVTPTAPTADGGGGFTAFTGPSPMALTITGGATGEFTWTMTAGAPGNLAFRGNALGTVEGSSLQVESASGGSNICRILTEQMSISQVAADETTVTRGQTGVPVSVTLSNTGSADLNIASLSFTARQGATDRSPDYTAVIVSPTIPAHLSGTGSPPWWNTAYKYRQRLRITADDQRYPPNSSSQITIKTNDLIAAGKLQGDLDDWRLMQWIEGTGWVQLDRHYISSNKSIFKIRNEILPYGRDEGYYVYYGNTAATSADLAANRKNCYIFWEDWEGSVYGNGFSLLADISQPNFPGWATNDAGVNGIYISRNNNDTSPLQLGPDSSPLLAAQSLCFRGLDFGNTFNLNKFAQAARSIDTSGYHHLQLTYHRYFDNGCTGTTAGTNYDWGRVKLYDGAAWNELIFYPANGPNDDLWHEETYDLSGYQTGPGWQIQFEANFWYGWSTNNNRLCFDDIRLFMNAPNAIGLGEETIPVTTLIATLSVDVSVAAAAGLTTIDAAATATSVVATGVQSIVGATLNDQWTVSTSSLQTFSDGAATIPCSRFARGQPITVLGTGFPSLQTLSLCWYDAFPPDAAPIASLPVSTNAGGSLTQTYTPTAAFRYGLGTIQVRNGATHLATGSARILEKPFPMPSFELSPATSSLGTPMTAALSVTSSVFGDLFEAGIFSSAWTTAGPGTEILDTAAAYAANPPSQFVHLSYNAAGAETLTRVVNLRDMTGVSLHARYSTVFAGAPVFVVETSPDGVTWTSLFTETAQLGIGIWKDLLIALPEDLLGNSNVRIRFRLQADAGGMDHLLLDDVYLTGQSENHERLRIIPHIWEKAPGGDCTGNGVCIQNPQPASNTLSCGETVSFTALYTPTQMTSAGTRFYLHGPVENGVLASGVSLLDGQDCHVPDTRSTGVSISQKALQVTPGLVDMGTVGPGQTSPSRSVTITNTGNLDLEHLKWEFHNLASDPYFIPPDGSVGTPDMIGALAVGDSTTGGLRVTIPPMQEPGTYTAYQFVFEDTNQDGASIGDAIAQFLMRVVVPPTELLRANHTSLFLGSWLANDRTATASLMVTNIGNMDQIKVRFVISDLKYLGNTIPSSSASLQPVIFGLMSPGDARWVNFSVQIPNAQTPGTYVGTGTFLNDKDVDTLADPGEASSAVSLSLIVGPNESLDIVSATVTLPNVSPGQVTFSPALRLSNTGGLPLERLQFVSSSLTVSGRTIDATNVTIAPAPLPTVGTGLFTTFVFYVDIPFDQDRNPGPAYSGVQTIFNDRNGNGLLDAGEARDTITISTNILDSRNFAIVEEIANFGAGVPNETVEIGVHVVNIGNLDCQNLKWKCLSPLSNGVTTFAVSPPGTQPAFNPGNGGNGWDLTPPATVATLSINPIPLAATPGTYWGSWTLWNDLDNDTVIDAGEASDTVTGYLEVGVDGVDILDSSPLDLGSAAPGEKTPPVIFSVKNIGERTLTRLLYEKPNLIQAPYPALTPFFQIYSYPDPIGLLTAGVTWAPSIQVAIPENQGPGLYSGPLRVFQDDLPDETYTSPEKYDTITLHLLVKEKLALRFEASPLDLGGINKGETIAKTFTAFNVGNKQINNLKYLLSPLKDGGNSIPTGQLSLQVPPSPWALPWTGPSSQVATFTVTTLTTTPTGNYSGEVTFWEETGGTPGLDAGESFWKLPVKISVGAKSVDVLATTINFGNIAKGNDTATQTFTVRNTGTVFLSNLKIDKQPVGAIGTPDIRFLPNQVAPPALNPGVTRDISVSIHTTPTTLSGTFSGEQWVYEDLNGNGVREPLEPQDSFVLTLIVTSGGALSYEMVTAPNPLIIVAPRNTTATRSFHITSICDNPLTNVQMVTAAPILGAFTIPASNLRMTPPSVNIQVMETVDASLSVTIPSMQPAGRYYTATQTVIDLDHPAATAPLMVYVEVPPTKFTITPSVFTPISAAQGSTVSFGFTLTNTGPYPIALDAVGTNLVGPGIIPFSAANVLFGMPTLAIGGTVNGTCSLTIDPATPIGFHVGTMTIRDALFQNEASPTVQIPVQVTGPAGIPEVVYQTITGPDKIATSTAYVFSSYLLATAPLHVDPNPASTSRVLLRVTEWCGTASTTHEYGTNGIRAEEINISINRWQRYSFAFTSTSSALLGSFTVELGLFSTKTGEAVMFDGIQLEKAVTLPGLSPAQEATPWTPERGVVTPTRQNGLFRGTPYYTW
ncbi:MAG TPA: hypothetical protein PLP29_04055 [Candidatus Ozemobacteraceae bacterium]|nr:hypothetical protein [Candidatus Ozemobacteraceae bacterium]